MDSVKPVVSWARENMEASGLDGVRWIVEDALKFEAGEVSAEEEPLVNSWVAPRDLKIKRLSA